MLSDRGGRGCLVDRVECTTPDLLVLIKDPKRHIAPIIDPHIVVLMRVFHPTKHHSIGV